MCNRGRLHTKDGAASEARGRARARKSVPTAAGRYSRRSPVGGTRVGGPNVSGLPRLPVGPPPSTPPYRLVSYTNRNPGVNKDTTRHTSQRAKPRQDPLHSRGSEAQRIQGGPLGAYSPRFSQNSTTRCFCFVHHFVCARLYFSDAYRADRCPTPLLIAPVSDPVRAHFLVLIILLGPSPHLIRLP